jgi:hypothetical protein
MTDRMLKLEDFEGLIGETFTIVSDIPDLPEFTLTEAKALPSHGAELPRPPFSLVFDMVGQQRFDQGLFPLHNDALGTAEVFLVPMAKTADGMRFAATFA